MGTIMSLFGKESKDWTEDDKTAIMLYHNLGLSVINRAWTAKNGRLEDLTAKSTLSVFSASDLAFVAILFQYYWKDNDIPNAEDTDGSSDGGRPRKRLKIVTGENRKAMEEDYFTLRNLIGEEMTKTAFVSKMRAWDTYVNTVDATVRMPSRSREDVDINFSQHLQRRAAPSANFSAFLPDMEGVASVVAL